MPRLNGRSVFRLSRFGVRVFDVGYDDANGADMSGVSAGPPEERDVTELSDDEFEAQLDSLQRAVGGGGHH